MRAQLKWCRYEEKLEYATSQKKKWTLQSPSLQERKKGK